jgi:hypothetical protein
MKQGYLFASQRVMNIGNTAFEFIATPAGKAEIFKDSSPTLGLGNNMIHSHRLAGIGLSGVTVSTVAIVYLN